MVSDFDDAFAKFVTVPQTEVYPVDCEWSDAELATIPFAYATAETMLHRARCSPADLVLVNGASDGVSSAALQLAKRRGAYVTARTSWTKAETVRELGADEVVQRGEDILSLMGEKSVDLVVDSVAGEMFPLMLKLLRRSGRYTSLDVIAGPVLSLDMPVMYLKDISLIGTTAWDETVFHDLIR